MYIVKINDFYVSDLDLDVCEINVFSKIVYGYFNVFKFEASKFLKDAKIFTIKEQAQEIAEQIGGEVIEYEKKKYIEADEVEVEDE